MAGARDSGQEQDECSGKLDHLEATSKSARRQHARGPRTFGAMLTIFPHPFILRSALTTPPIRVPSISRLLFSNTAALSSNQMYRPSGLRTGFLVRTMTARRTSPLRTLTAVLDAWAAADTGRARFTTQTISSPTPPQPLLTFCLRTLTHSTRSAPELSMTYQLYVSFVPWGFGRVAHIERAFETNHRKGVEGEVENADRSCPTDPGFQPKPDDPDSD